MTEANPLLDFPLHIDIPIAWGEMDAFGHVNNVVYFRYFETARIAYFEQIGWVEQMKKTGVGPILASTSCRFRRPLSHPGSVRVGARVTDRKSDRFTMAYRVVDLGSGIVAAEGEGLVVCYDYRASAKAPLPEQLVSAISAFDPASEMHPSE